MLFDQPFDTIFWITSFVGLTILLVYGSIFGWLRQRVADWNDKAYELISCGQCLGFWVGVLGSIAIGFIGIGGCVPPDTPVIQQAIAHVAMGCIVSLLSTITSRIIQP